MNTGNGVVDTDAEQTKSKKLAVFNKAAKSTKVNSVSVYNDVILHPTT